MMAEI